MLFGHRGKKKKLVLLLDGGRPLLSPHVVAYENTRSQLSWSTDPREIFRSLPQHVQERLRGRKTGNARNQGFNVPDDAQPPILPSKGRGEPKQLIQRPYCDQVVLVLESPILVDYEIIRLIKGIGKD